METIIYLKLERDEPKNVVYGLPPMIHFRQLAEERHFLVARIPWAALDPWTLAGYAGAFLGHSSSVETVYDKSMEGWLKKRGLWEWWGQNWPFSEYREYHREEYADRLLKKAVAQGGPRRHFLVIGFEPFLAAVLMKYAKEMKSLRVIVDREASGLEAFAEDVFEEYGLAVSCRNLTDQHRLQRDQVRLAWERGRQEGAVILDLSGEKKPLLHPPEGSVWLDMDSQGEKRRRVEAYQGVSYFSMKKEWESLDTVSKNGYNTDVN